MSSESDPPPPDKAHSADWTEWSQQRRTDLKTDHPKDNLSESGLYVLVHFFVLFWKSCLPRGCCYIYFPSLSPHHHHHHHLSWLLMGLTCSLFLSVCTPAPLSALRHIVFVSWHLSALALLHVLHFWVFDCFLSVWFAWICLLFLWTSSCFQSHSIFCIWDFVLSALLPLCIWAHTYQLLTQLPSVGDFFFVVCLFSALLGLSLLDGAVVSP